MDETTITGVFCTKGKISDLIEEVEKTHGPVTGVRGVVVHDQVHDMVGNRGGREKTVELLITNPLDSGPVGGQ